MTALRLLAVLALVMALLLLALHPLRFTHATWGNARTLSWWIVHTPACTGPVCIDVFADHASLEWHWAG